MGSVEGKKPVKRPPMRSSIACLRCRKSKIKCDNDGRAITPCDTCIKTGKECIYPEATPLPPKRPDPPTTIRREGDGVAERKRLRKIEDGAQHDPKDAAANLAKEVLAASYLTEALWNHVFEIFRLHFATELPFLHMPTLKEKMANKASQSDKDRWPDTNLVLLGVLTLTARFHPDLVKYVANQGMSAKSRVIHANPDASLASEYYADQLTRALGPLKLSMAMATVERVQAFLMLGLYEWSQAKPNTGGLGAWMYVGVAIRMAQALGLSYGDRPLVSNRPRATDFPSDMDSEAMVEKEVRRRTMFSCFSLDRMLSCGKERISTIRSEDLQIQLPCPEHAFDLSQDVQTGFLKPLADEEPVALNVHNDSILARFIRLIDIWGEISKYSFAGGRLSQRDPPWSENTAFYRLRTKLDNFYADLPPTFTLSKSNYHKHENHHASSVFVSLHMLGSVCQIMLHREFVPFIPIQCAKPTGPLDEPTFPGEQRDDFWEESAEHLFKAAKNIVDLIEICQSREKLPMSALVLFAIWTAAFVGIYAWHFPHMDVTGYMLPVDDVEYPENDIGRVGPTGVAYETLTKMSAWLKMANTYVVYFREMHRYYEKVKADYRKHARGGGGGGHHHPSGGEKQSAAVRYGGGGGGLEEWDQQNRKIVNNGTIMAEDEMHVDASEESRASTLDRGSSMGADSYNTPSADRVRTPRSTPSMSFTAINSGGGGNMMSQQQPEGGGGGGGHALGPRHDGLAGEWERFNGLPPNPPAAAAAAYTMESQFHGIDYYEDINVTDYVRANERIRWGDSGHAAGGLQDFSIGEATGPAIFKDPNAALYEHQNPMGYPKQYTPVGFGTM